MYPHHASPSQGIHPVVLVMCGSSKSDCEHCWSLKESCLLSPVVASHTAIWLPPTGCAWHWLKDSGRWAIQATRDSSNSHTRGDILLCKMRHLATAHCSARQPILSSASCCEDCRLLGRFRVSHPASSSDSALAKPAPACCVWPLARNGGVLYQQSEEEGTSWRAVRCGAVSTPIP